MTLLDAPKYDDSADILRRKIIYGTAAAFCVLVIGWWLFTGTPKDWPWYWNLHWRGEGTVNHFMKAVEEKDLVKAYGIWRHDPDWQAHHDELPQYDFKRFTEDWRPDGTSNDFGVIKSHEIPAARVYGNVLVVGLLMNQRKSGAIFLAYDPKTGELGYSSVELYLGP